jgi:DNA-binding transcriptional ArsR family regulator
MEVEMDLLKLIKALADETRMKIVRHLSKKRYCVHSLSNLTGISQSAVSQHLKILREAELVKCEKIGYWSHYELRREQLSKVGEFLLELSKSIPEDECMHHKDRHESAPCEDNSQCECSRHE